MLVKTKILVVGIGGVGGYFGGLLAKCYAGVVDTDIYFFARGEHLTQIRAHGLTVIKGDIEFTQKPCIATDDATEVGIVDYILLCTKNYDVDEVLDQLKPCIGEKTVIVPLLNGVEAVEKIRNKLPLHLIPSGCAYIISAIKSPGVVENMGNRQEIYFGLENSNDSRLETLEVLLKFAGIEATLSQQISKLIWEKFIFLSCIATATSYYNKPIGELLENHMSDLETLLSETRSLAIAKQIHVDDDILEKAMTHYHALPYHATSSMQRDFNAKKPKTELDAITGYVVRESKAMGLNAPFFNKAYLELQNPD